MKAARSFAFELPDNRGGALCCPIGVLAAALIALLLACTLAASSDRDTAWAGEQSANGLDAGSADVSAAGMSADANLRDVRAAASAGAFLVEGGTETTDWSYSNNVLTVLTGTPLTISMSSGPTSSDRIVIDTSAASAAAGGTVAAKVTFDSVGIDTRSTGDESARTVGKPPVHVLSGALDLKLAGETALVPAYGCACVQNGENALTISGAGKLLGNQDGISTSAACIGGGVGESGSNITIDGGTLVLKTVGRDTGIGGGAAIGGGAGGAGTNITINDGSVEARVSSYGGAGIGGGWGQAGDGKDITINGGIVVANGSYGGAGIGAGGSGAVAENISITGGTVTAKGGSYGAGIGGAFGWDASGKSAGSVKNISITGGSVTASTVYGCAAIGAALYGSVDGITIKNANVTATVENGSGAAIGSGGGDSWGAPTSASNIVIENAEVTAKAHGGGAGIGGGSASRNGGGTVSGITIEDSIVTASTRRENPDFDGASAIGGGKGSGDVSGIVISGGQITATGSFDADAIGDGAESTAAHEAEVTITGGVFGAGTFAKDDADQWVGDVYAVLPAAGYAVVANAEAATATSHPYEVVGQSAPSISVSAPSGLVYSGEPIDGSGFTAKASYGATDASSSAVLEYKLASAADSAYSAVPPISAGAYTVRATVGPWATESVAYAGASAEAGFSVAKAAFAFDGPAGCTVRAGSRLDEIAVSNVAQGIAVNGTVESVQGRFIWYTDEARTQMPAEGFSFSGNPGSTAILYWSFVPAENKANANYTTDPVEGIAAFTIAQAGTDPGDKSDDELGDGSDGGKSEIRDLPSPEAGGAALPSVGDAYFPVTLIVIVVLSSVLALGAAFVRRAASTGAKRHTMR